MDDILVVFSISGVGVEPEKMFQYQFWHDAIIQYLLLCYLQQPNVSCINVLLWYQKTPTVSRYKDACGYSIIIFQLQDRQSLV